MNQVTLIGYLCNNPELRFAASTGKAVTNFRLAVNRRFSKENKADFFRIVVWDKLAENCAQYLKKGSQCAVVGRIQIEPYTDKDGNQRYSTDVIASEVEFLGKVSASEETYDDSFPVVDTEEIPF